jgi:hypothetical protein
MRHAIAVFTAVAIFAVAPLRAQTPEAAPPAPENLAAARQLIEVTKVTDRFKALLPVITQAIKPAVVQNRPDVEKRFDALMPLFAEAANARVNEVTDKIAAIYARIFSVEELRRITDFYRTPAGQKFVASQQAIVTQTLALGQDFGRELAADIRARAQQELNKNGNAN